MRVFRTLISTVTALGLLSGVAEARGGGPAFAMRPAGDVPYFKFAAQPGAVYSGRVQVANVGKATGTVHLYAVDATTGATSGATYRDVTHRRRDVGAWTQLAQPSLQLRPRERRTVAFTVRVPADAVPGDHLGGIVADGGVQPGPSVRRRQGRFRLSVRPLTVIAVQATLPGEREPGLSLDALRAGGMPGHQQLVIRMTNTGNVLFKGRGSVVVRDEDGRRLKRARFALDTFVPRTHISYPVFVPGSALPVGRYGATVTVHFAGRTVTRDFTFEVADKIVRQTFGGRRPSFPDLGMPGSGIPTLALVIGALGALLAGFGGALMLVCRRERKRLDALGEV